MANATIKNTFYHGDCLLVLKHDIPTESVDLIYLDPPFFTGKIQKGTKKWQPGAMEVSFEDSKRFWEEKGVAKEAPVWMKHIARKCIQSISHPAELSNPLCPIIGVQSNDCQA